MKQFLNWFRRGNLESGLDRELGYHFDRRVSDLMLSGVAAALAAGRLISSFLFGTAPRDPVAISAVVVMLLLVASLACWAPARRASHIDPMAALRNE